MRVNKTIAGIFVAAGMIVPVAGASAASDPVPATAPGKAPDDLSKRVCRVVTPTGSRFTSRVCKTEAEWRKDAELTQNRLEEEARGNRDLSPPR